MHNIRTRKLALYIATAAASVSAVGSATAVERKGVEEVIVTAQRDDQRLQDVPISITVFDQQQLSDRNVVNAADLATYTPSLSADKRFGSDFTTFSIRGFSQEFRTAASVGVFFADVVAPRGGGVATTAGDGGGPGSFFDLQNVQVLKGPQGTLFGRNTTGGDVLIIPQRPTDKLEGYLEGSAGNYDMKRLQGVINIPLSDSARMRVGVDRQTRDGYLNNNGIGPKHLANTNYITGRASLIVDITPKIENYTIASYTNSENHGSVSQVFASRPGGPLTSFVAGQIAESKSDFYSVANDLTHPRARLNQYQLINTTAWEATDLLTVKNIASYSVIMSDVAQDTFGTYIQRPTGVLYSVSTATPKGLHTTNQYNITEELQLQGRTADDLLNWQAGVYYEKSAPRNVTGSRSGAFATCSDLSNLKCISGSASDSLGTLEYQNVAVFGQGTYELTDSLKMTAGLRYTEDRTWAMNELAGYSFRNGGALTVVTCRADGSTAIPCPQQHFDKVTRAPTWVIDLEYTPSVDTLAYAKYSRGYRQGGINPFGGAGFTEYDAEKVDAFEIGTKRMFNGNIPGMINLSAFYNDLSNQQLQATLYNAAAPTTATTAIVNAGKSHIYGLELESSILPFDGFKFDASAAYLETKIVEITPPSLPASSPYNVSLFFDQGGPLPFTPKYKTSMTGTYTLPLPPSVGKVSFATTYTYQSGSTTAPQGGTPYHDVDSSDLVNLNLSWTKVMGSPVDTSFFVTNLFNNEYVTFVSGLYTQAGFETRQVGQPRMFGMRVRYSFGR